VKVDELAAHLQSAGSLRERLSLIATHWSELRKLPRAQRENIAIGMGSRWASRRMMRLMEADGKLTEGERLAKSALEQLGSGDPRELRKLAGQLKEGNFDGVEHVFIGALGSAVDARATEVTDGPSAEPPPLPVEVEEIVVPEAQEPVEIDLAESAEELTSVLAAVAAARLDEESQETTGESPEVQAVPAVDAAPAPVAPVMAPTTTPRIEAMSEAESTALEIDPSDADSPVTESRWRLRRSVSNRIRDRGYASLDAALEAVGQLAPADHKWCLGDLIEHWVLDPGDLVRILDASPDERTRKRLATRAMR